MRYAKGTDVSVVRSRTEIEEIVTRYGATAFGSMTEGARAAVAFQCHGRRVMFQMSTPLLSEFETFKHRKRTERQARIAWEQACRQKWRALALVIKAKLEAVETGITTFEDEFMAHIVLPDGRTVGAWMKPQIMAAYESGHMPSLLPAVGDT